LLVDPGFTVTADPVLVEVGLGGEYRSEGKLAPAPSPASTWSGLADYGDGSGPIPFELRPDGSFSLAHRYDSLGKYTIFIMLRDERNRLAGGYTSCLVRSSEAPVKSRSNLRDSS
jgi:hypothetical protein